MMGGFGGGGGGGYGGRLFNCPLTDSDIIPKPETQLATISLKLYMPLKCIMGEHSSF